MNYLEITYKLETSDHSGYCSGDECEYNEECDTYLMKVPDELQSYELNIDIPLEAYDWNSDNLPEALVPDRNLSGSDYCDLSEDSKNHGLGKHDYRLTIIKMRIVESE